MVATVSLALFLSLTALKLLVAVKRLRRGRGRIAGALVLGFGAQASATHQDLAGFAPAGWQRRATA